MTTAYQYGFSDQIRYCKRCVIPNTKPVSRNEYKHTPDQSPKYIRFDDDGVCSACRFSEQKWSEKTDWNAREEELLDLLARHRKNDGAYDCIVPGSGGKDSCYAAHLLKYKYGMHPLTVTWSPHLYTEIGWQNFQSWIHVGGFDNFLFTPNGKVHRLLARNAFINLLHPFQPFIFGQKTFAPKMAEKFNVPLVFYGENPGEYGANVSFDQRKFASNPGQRTSSADAGHSMDYGTSGAQRGDIYLGGKSVKQYMEEGLEYVDLAPYLPVDQNIITERNIEVHYLGAYVRWLSQEAYYYATAHTGFTANPVRSEGTYSKYSSLDDKLDGLLYYTNYIKFGYGRASQEASQEIRNKHITRDEAIALVMKYDGEFPRRYFLEDLGYLSLTEGEFHEICDRFRSPKIWEKDAEGWKLRHTVWMDSR